MPTSSGAGSAGSGSATRIEVVRLDENDPNHIREYRLSIDAAESRLVDDVRDLAENLRVGHYPT